LIHECTVVLQLLANSKPWTIQCELWLIGILKF